MSGTHLRSGKSLPSSTSLKKQENKQPKGHKKTDAECEVSIMSAEVIQELKSMRSELRGQMTKLSDDLTNFQRETNDRLSKIESVIARIEEIDEINTKVSQITEDVAGVKEALDFMDTTVGGLDSKTRDLQKSNQELLKRVDQLERYSRDFNIRILGVEEEEGEDCILILQEYLALLGFQDAIAEIENAHRTGKRNEEGKPRHIIAKLYSRPFKRKVLQVAKSPDKKALLNGIRFVEDFTPNDFEARKKALPIMKTAFEEGKKVRFSKGKLFIEGKVVPLD